MPFKMMGKSPLMKKLVGKQGELPENLKAAIKAAPGTSPGKMVSPLKEDKENKATAQRKKAAKIVGSLFGDYGSFMPDSEAARKARGEGNKTASEKSKTGKTEGSGAATANQNAGQTFQDLQKKIAGMSQAQKDSIKKMQNKMSGKKKTTPPKATPKVSVEELKRRKNIKNPTELEKKGTSEAFKIQQKINEKAAKPQKADKKPERKVKKGVSNNLLGRSGYTTGSGTNIKSKREGSKFEDGGKDVTTSTSVNDKLVKTRNVSKGASGSGDRIVTKKKYNKDGTVRKTVIKGKKGGKRIDKKVNLPKAKKAEVKSEEKKPVASKFKVASGGGAPSLKGAGQGLTGVTFGTKKEKKKKKSPGKMVKSPAKNYKKGYYK
tara:strand:- start:795 stop:1925 length:1131 start_codon:yes stop_codon:yes gene_type:complete